MKIIADTQISVSKRRLVWLSRYFRSIKM